MAKKIQKREPITSTRLIPIYIMSAVIPLIVYMKFITLEGILYKTWKGYEYFGDFFNYYKSVGIILTASVAIIFMLTNFKKSRVDLKKQTDFVPAAVYLLFIIISTIFSEYIQVSLGGFTERYEGLPVLISYIFICFYTAVTIISEEEIKKILIFLGASCVIIGIIGIFQYFGMDIFQSEWGIKLILPSAYRQYAEQMKFTYSEKMVYGTLYNPNFAGSYSSMLLLISIGLVYYLKDTKQKIIASVLFCGAAFIIWTGSMSRAGIVGGIFGLIVFFILQFKSTIRNWKYISIIGILAVLSLSFNYVYGGRIVSEFDKINPLKEIERINKENEKFYVEEIKTDNSGILIKTRTETIRIEKENEDLVFYDDKGAPIEAQFSEGTYSFIEEPYEKYKVMVVSHEGDYILGISGYTFNLKYTEQGFKRITATGEITKIENAERVSFLDGMELFGSGRGFIWSRTIPMIKNTILKGYGPDTFAIYFPQWDVAGKINGLHDPSTIVDKPHNWYLQTAVNTGLVSLLAVIAFIFMYLLKTLKIYFKSQNRQELVLQSAVFSAIISYCVAGFFNDSVVSVAPVFWVLLGVGIAHNRILAKVNTAKIYKR